MLSRMHTMLFVMVFVAFGWAGLALGQQKPEELAQQSSEAWLTLIDRGQFADSYQEAAQYFKNAVTKDQWQNSLTAVRKPLARSSQENSRNTTYTRTLPGAPDGDYVVIQYESSFKHKASAVETVIEDPGQRREMAGVRLLYQVSGILITHTVSFCAFDASHNLKRPGFRFEDASWRVRPGRQSTAMSLLSQSLSSCRG